MAHSNNWWESSCPACLEALDAPVLFTDPQLNVLWANPKAAQLELAKDFALAWERQIFLGSASTIFDNISKKTTVTIAWGGLLDRRRSYRVSPVFAGELLQGCVVALAPAQEGVPSSPAQTERALAVFSHQLRGPLSAIFSALSCIRSKNDSEYEDPDIYSYVRGISSQCYRLLRSTVNIAEMHRYEHGLSTFSPQKQDLCLFSSQLCKMSSMLIEALGIRFSCSVPEEPLPVLFDENKLAAVLLHLISNAAKFIGENGRITVEVARSGRQAVVTVTDNGLGIPPDIAGHVFEPYFSYNPRDCDLCGDGLGLTICREAIRAHGGTIAFHSQEGEGTRVAFSLPLCPEDGSPLEAQDMASGYLLNRFSSMYVILSDVCSVPEN